MRVCLVGPAYPYRGGIAHFTSMLAREFVKDHDVLVVNFKRLYPWFLFPGKTQYDESDSPLRVDSERVIDSMNPLTFFCAARTIARRVLRDARCGQRPTASAENLPLRPCVVRPRRRGA